MSQTTVIKLPKAVVCIYSEYSTYVLCLDTKLLFSHSSNGLWTNVTAYAGLSLIRSILKEGTKVNNMTFRG